ncbi:MAG TPA: hypothetical protein VNV37_12645 [Solirubrobacteraceae bacterium]|jgi:hypothetical protein|nr:hypothetical protein [Solirubrobacteraceae bacterium]
MSPATLDTLTTAAAASPSAAGAAGLGAPAPRAPTPDTKIYRGRTVEQLIPKIQAELGADAVVVRREKGLTGGFAGFFQRPFVEIEARRGAPTIDCYDEKDGAPALPEPPAPPAPVSPAPASTPIDRCDEPFRELATGAMWHLGPSAGLDAPMPAHDTPTPVLDDTPFAAALAEAEAAVRPPALHMPAATARAGAPGSRARATIERALGEAGMSDAFVGELIAIATAHVLPLMPGRPSFAKAVHAALVQRIPACAPLPAGGAAIALVGTGGAGKSACCAALLSAYRKRGMLPAAVAPLAAEPSAPARAALRETRAQGVLLLDTPALSPADSASIGALAATLAELAPDRVLLALPATLGATPAAQLLRALAPLRVNALAITHTDETTQLGVAVQSACEFGIPPVHLLRRPERARAGAAIALTPTDSADLADRLLPR